MAGQGGARELRIADNEPAGTFCDFHTSSLTKRGYMEVTQRPRGLAVSNAQFPCSSLTGHRADVL